MKRKIIFRYGVILFPLFLCFYNSQSQDTVSLAVSEHKILENYLGILSASPMDWENKAEKFFDEFYAVTLEDSSFNYPFLLLDKIGKIYSSDHKLRIYSWNIPMGIDDNLYFGIIQYYSRHTKKYIAVKLIDTRKSTQKITLKEWPGALYYQIVDTKNSGQNYYTLLGFNMNNVLSNKKVIDIITINDNDEISFCSNLIEYKKAYIDRLVFEYNKKASMMLRYEERIKMIVFDHLSPQKPSLEGNYQFYGPDFTYDGLKFENGIWKYYSNIDVKN
jgi:hypothetical protein